jgi:dTDP-4-amino-4,6-dideoxygalactose transaminase
VEDVVKVPLLDLGAQLDAIRDEVVPALMEVVESQRFIMGDQVRQLEEAVARYCGVEHAIGCASGTDALLLSLRTLDLEPGDEVITSTFTFFATAGAIANAGGTPVFVDIDPVTFNLDMDAVEAAITSRTRAVVPVHLYGQMAPMERLSPIAERHGLAVVEDCAQAIGARRTIDGTWERAGRLGSTGAFSFFPSKNLGGWGDGGMIVTRDARRAERLRKLRVHGGAKQYHHEEIGTNSRLDTLQAAVLAAKLPHLDAWNAARRAHAAAYGAAFERIAGVTPPATDPQNEHIFHQYTIRAERRDGLKDHLSQAGVGCAVYYPRCLHLQPCFASLGYRAGQLPVAERASADVLSLPVYPELSGRQREHVIATVRGFYA